MDTLYDYYKSKGQTLPSVSERTNAATSAGIQDYKGTAEQNNALLSYLKKQDTISPTVVNSNAAQQDYNNIQANYADITKSIAQQQQAQQNKQAVAQTTQATAPATTQTVTPTTPTAPKEATSPIVTPAQTQADYSNLVGKSSYNPKTGTYGILQNVTPSGTGYSVNFQGQNTQYLTPEEAQKLGYTEDQVAKEQLQASETRKMAEANRVMQQINDIQSGVIPLNQGQLAQVQALQKGFENLINQQQLLNVGAQGGAYMRGFQTGAAEYDPMFNVKTIGTIVSAGNNKLADLNIQMAGAIGQMTEAFKTANVEKVKSAWDIYQKTADEHKATLQKIIDDTQKQIKEANDKKIAAEKVYYDTVTKPIQDIYTTLAQIPGVPAQVIANVSKAQTVSEAIQAAGNYLQKGTGDIGDYLMYRNQAQGLGLKPLTYDEWKQKTTAVKTGGAAGKTTSNVQEIAQSNDNLSTILKTTKLGEGAKTALTLMLGVINATKDFAQNNQEDISGVNPAAGLAIDVFSSPKSIQNRAFLDAINLKVQQWASGAALTDAQTAMVNKMVPKKTDTDHTAKAKANALVNFMNQQIKGALEANGVDYTPPVANLFPETNEGTTPEEEQVLAIGEQYPDLRQQMATLKNEGVSDADIIKWAKQQK